MSPGPGTPFKPGQSGNPHGRPKKKRALTQALESAVSKSVQLPDGSRVNGKRYLASLAVQALTDGKVTLASGKTLDLSPEDLLFFWKFAYAQIDGNPPQAHEHTGEDGRPIEFIEVIKDAGSDGELPDGE